MTAAERPTFVMLTEQFSEIHEVAGSSEEAWVAPARPCILDYSRRPPDGLQPQPEPTPE